MIFCMKCGAQLAPGMKFCNACGNPVAQGGNVAPQPQMQQGFQPQMQQGFQNYNQMPMGYGAPKKGNKKIAIISIASAVVVAVAVLMIVLFGGGQGTRTKAVDKFMKAFQQQNASKMERVMKGKWKSRCKQLAGDNWKLVNNYFENRAGSNARIIDWNLSEEERLDEDDCKQISEYYLNGKKVSEAYRMEYHFYVSGDWEKVKYDILFVVAKVGTKWYIMDFDIDL